MLLWFVLAFNTCLDERGNDPYMRSEESKCDMTVDRIMGGEPVIIFPGFALSSIGFSCSQNFKIGSWTTGKQLQ